MTEIGVLLSTFLAGTLFAVFVVGLLAAAGKEAPTPFTEDAIRLVAQEQFRAGERVGRAESMRRRVGRADVEQAEARLLTLREAG